MAFTIDNQGIGADSFITMGNDATATKDFTQTDIDSNLTACTVSANNEAGMGAAGDKLLGKVVAVSTELQTGTVLPSRVTVQCRGVARFKYVATTPVINQMVEVDGAGAVKQLTADVDIAAGGHLGRGMVINVIAATTEVDVWLG